ncbi:glucoamylase family protein [Planctomycetota bacterium]
MRLCIAASMWLSLGVVAMAGELTATGHDQCIYLRWGPVGGGSLYVVERVPSEQGPWERITPEPLLANVHCDWLGENGKTFTYRVIAVRDGVETRVGSPVVGTSVAEDDEALLTYVQEATFRYFWDGAHPVSGLAYDRYQDGRPYVAVTTGGSGVGLMALVVGVERGFVSRAACAQRVLKVLTFLETRAQRYHGVFSHWLDGSTGTTIPFARRMHGGRPVLDSNGLPIDDDGGDLVETAFLIQGILTVRRYFDVNDPVEQQIREIANRLWREVEWDWHLNPQGDPGNKMLYWHWSPDHDFGMMHKFAGFCEAMTAYLLGIASPTHPIPAECYEDGWVTDWYENGREFYGHKIWVGPDFGGRLFWCHYPFLGFDPRGRDAHCNYFENSRNIALTHRAYCRDNPNGRAGFSEVSWGLTSSDVPNGYRANEPGNEDGTIAPTAALSSMPYTPAESMAALRHFYDTHGARLFGPFGFRDAFNLDDDWFAQSYLAIDQGPIVVMIENHRTGLLWELFMSCPEMAPMMDAIGWRREP